MNAKNTLKLACGALLVLACGYSWSQSGAASAASGGASASAAPAQSNRTLRRAVYAAFAKDKSIDAGDVGVSAKNGAVTLTGTVDRADQIDKAATLAKGVPGVVSVQNKLTVKRAFSQ
ncbi:transport-associated domain-containing protein [Caballeronia hypogeia]|uniref:Transport-associated domain-containing protein n=1 Tax=Caballeronia hypogeia TaxID=1777140 RepID=A0A158AFK3_9BURK|nr:BON domain-containing protein [Caballeronia hypogeia]SAK56641.1 transport-associated domain-containing protein [Caballeronia hypogeia]